MIDLTNIDTIYKKRFRTIGIQINARFRVGTKGVLSLQSFSQVYYSVLKGLYEKLDHDQEHFIVLFLNSANHLIGYKILFTGSQNSSVVDPKIVYRNAILFGAQQIILAHNHPSGNLLASPEDRIITRQIAKVGRFHNIKLLDHIIVTHDSYKSLASEEPELFDGSTLTDIMH